MSGYVIVPDRKKSSSVRNIQKQKARTQTASDSRTRLKMWREKEPPEAQAQEIDTPLELSTYLGRSIHWRSIVSGGGMLAYYRYIVEYDFHSMNSWLHWLHFLSLISLILMFTDFTITSSTLLTHLLTSTVHIVFLSDTMWMTETHHW